MHVIDLRRADRALELRANICLIGSGPAGLTIARELRHSGLSVLIVESGGLAEEVPSLSEIENVGEWRAIDQQEVRNRIFGGTSHSWTGRCVPLDALDYEARPWLPSSGWPIGPDDMAPYVRRAAGHLRIDPDFVTERPRPSSGPPFDSGVLKDISWQFSEDNVLRDEFTRFGPRFLAASAPNTTVLVHASVTHLTTNADGSRMEAVEVGNREGKRATVRADAVVLAAGGIENARLLLCSNRVVPNGVGNAHDVVGRFLMDHPRCNLGDFDLKQGRSIWDRFGYYRAAVRRGTHLFIDGVGLSGAVQHGERLLNCSAWLDDEKAPDDPLDAAKRLLKRQSRNWAGDCRAVLSQPGLVARAVQDRLVHRKVTLHKMQRLCFLCIVEQAPDRDSRISLGRRRDVLGLPMPSVDWRIGELERITAIRLGHAVEAEFKRVGLPPPQLVDWIRHSRPDEAQFIDVAHPIGTTRMANDPRQGVVDRNCGVHGVEGLFIAGSSVFPTAGHANPTLTIVALAVRLADHLKARVAVSGQARTMELQPA